MMLPAGEAAFAAGVTTATLRKWAQRGHISRAVDGWYDMDEIAAYSATRDSGQWFAQAVAARKRRGVRRVA